MTREYLAGIYYFPGWWPEQPNFWIRDGHEWLADYPTRRPLCGLYNNGETMDAEIDAAASRGVDFFQILWYPSAENFTHSFRALNAGPELFMASPQAKRMRFAFEYCNHPPYAPMDDKVWARHCGFIARCVAHPSYLYIGGKAYVKIYGAEHFLEQHGDDGALAAKRLELLRTRVLKETGRELLLCAGSVPEAPLPDPIARLLKGFDCFGTYGDVPEPEKLPPRAEPYPYEMLVDTAAARWDKSMESCPLPYVPFLMCGWDPRPWKDHRASFVLPDAAAWRGALLRLKGAMDTNTQMGLPDGKGGRQKMMTLYAWNEFGEGGFLAPTQGEGDWKLRVLQEVFGLQGR